MNHVYTFESNANLFDVAKNASKIIAKKVSNEKGKFWRQIFLILKRNKFWFWISIDFEKEPVGYGRFKMCDVKKEFAEKTSSGNYIISQEIEIFGIKWYVGIKKCEHRFSIFLSRTKNEK